MPRTKETKLYMIEVPEIMEPFTYSTRFPLAASRFANKIHSMLPPGGSKTSPFKIERTKTGVVVHILPKMKIWQAAKSTTSKPLKLSDISTDKIKWNKTPRHYMAIITPGQKTPVKRAGKIIMFNAKPFIRSLDDYNPANLRPAEKGSKSPAAKSGKRARDKKASSSSSEKAQPNGSNFCAAGDDNDSDSDSSDDEDDSDADVSMSSSSAEEV